MSSENINFAEILQFMIFYCTYLVVNCKNMNPYPASSTR